MNDYLTENHPHGCFNAGNRCCLDNLVYNYDEEGVVLWDFPMNFDWDNMALPAAAAIEKFSDFGTCLRSLKYKGKKCYARGHVVVFANRPPIAELAHRNIKEFHIDSYVPPALRFKEPGAPMEDRVHLDVSRMQPASKRKPKVSEQSEPEAKPPKAAAPKRSRTTKTPQPSADEVFELESCENTLIDGICHADIELEGGSASPKAKHQKSPLQAPPEASPEGDLAQAKDLDRCSWHGSEASTEFPDSFI